MPFISVNLLYPPTDAILDTSRAPLVLNQAFEDVAIHSHDALADSRDGAIKILDPTNRADRVVLEQLKRNCESEGPAISFSVNFAGGIASGTIKKHYADFGSEASLPEELVDRFGGELHCRYSCWSGRVESDD